MNDRQAIFAAFFGSLLIAVCGVSLVFANSANLQQITEQTQIRDAAIQYIQNNHPETNQFLTDPNWTGGKVETQQLETETYSYTSQGWKITVQNPIVPSAMYIITANYSNPSGGASIPYAVLWHGTFNNGVFAETCYSFAQ